MTAPALERINAEHVVIAAMMNAMEAETNALAASGLFDLELVRLILRYMDEYPDRFHHPKEEMLFDVAEAKSSALAEKLSAVRKEHAALPGATERVITVIEAIDLGESLPREKVLEVLRAYIARERQHIVIERDDIFPLLEGVLTDQEWDAATDRFAQMEDPLSGGADPGPYKRLQGLILPSL